MSRAEGNHHVKKRFGRIYTMSIFDFEHFSPQSQNWVKKHTQNYDFFTHFKRFTWTKWAQDKCIYYCFFFACRTWIVLNLLSFLRIWVKRRVFWKNRHVNFSTSSWNIKFTLHFIVNSVMRKSSFAFIFLHLKTIVHTSNVAKNIFFIFYYKTSHRVSL